MAVIFFRLDDICQSSITFVMQKGKMFSFLDIFSFLTIPTTGPRRKFFDTLEVELKGRRVTVDEDSTSSF